MTTMKPQSGTCAECKKRNQTLVPRSTGLGTIWVCRACKDAHEEVGRQLEALRRVGADLLKEK